MVQKLCVFAFIFFVYVSLSKCEETTTQSTTWDKIKDGLKVAYDEVHCQFHKIKEYVKHHEHDVDPCEAKKGVTPTTIIPDSEVEQIGNTQNPNYVNNDPTGTLKPYGWQVQ